MEAGRAVGRYGVDGDDVSLGAYDGCRERGCGGHQLPWNCRKSLAPGPAPRMPTGVSPDPAKARGHRTKCPVRLERSLFVEGAAVAGESAGDLLGALVPGEGSGVVVPGLDPVADVLGERLDAAVRGALELLGGQG